MKIKMKLVRPFIPLAVRLQVISWQLQSAGRTIDVLMASQMCGTDREKLKFMLKQMFGEQKVHLDHDPPLCLREIVDADRGIYEPDANNPLFLTYRTEEDHRVKTFIRGDGAQLSDAAKRRKEIKRKKRESEKKWDFRWPKRKLRWKPKV